VSTFVSLFAGVGGFDLGFEKAGHTCVGQVEIDKNAQKILKKHWPDIPLHDDVKTAIEWAKEINLIGKVDIVCGGFPCQDVSVAGKRAGIAGARSGLFWDAIRFAQEVKAHTIVLENVPGLLSSNEGRDFGVVISEMANAGYSHIEWRVLDSQFFGVPPNDAVESSLLEVLETEVSPRYLLSPKACEGIMRRATRRGKTLPPALEKALLQGCEASEITK
jgi:DNA (cytosine-5)-methyltransferase 1